MRRTRPIQAYTALPLTIALLLGCTGCSSPSSIVRPTECADAAEPASAAGPEQCASAPSGTTVDNAEPPAVSGTPPGGFDNFHEIEPGRAYRSAQLAPDTLRYAIQKYGIRTVVNLRGPNPKDAWYQQERQVCEALGVELVDVRLSVSELPSRANLLRMYDTFTGAGGPVLIHCKSGSDRTGMAAAVWRMSVLGEDRAAAARQLALKYGHIRAAHPQMDELVEQFKPERDWITQAYRGAGD